MKTKAPLILAALLAIAACSQNKPDVLPQDVPATAASSMPSPTAHVRAGEGKPCQVAKDCHGALPHLCVKCPAGTSGGCAHWACIDGGCQIKTCE